MKPFRLAALSALFFAFPVASHAQPTEEKSAVANPTTPLEEFDKRWNALHDSGDFVALRQLGHDWEIAHPEDYRGPFTQALASYLLGDIEGTISRYEKLIAERPDAATAGGYAGTLGIARTIRRNYPDLQLEPLSFPVSDAALELKPYFEQAAALLKAKNYDEIERVAAQLQKSKATNVKGTPYLDSFFDGLLADPDGFGALRSRIAAWRAARPQSNLARLAALQMWTTDAYKERGTGYASSITPAMEARMSEALDKGLQTLQTLPKSAYDSPLAYDAAMTWGLLAGMPREGMDSLFEDASAKFPDYLPLFQGRSNALLPRWGGEPGEWEAMAKKAADRIAKMSGSEDGDVFYARIVWSLAQRVDLVAESKFPYERVKRGLEILQKRFPDSMAVASARLAMAYHSQDSALIKQLLAAPQGNKLDPAWWLWETPRNQAIFAEIRMGILGEPKT